MCESPPSLKRWQPVSHCKVAGVIGTETNFELLLPEDWKRQLGDGRWRAGLSAASLTRHLDTVCCRRAMPPSERTQGHRGSAIDASWALNNLERIVSFGHQAVHRTAVTAKALIADYYYGQDALPQHVLWFAPGAVARR